MKLSYNEEKKSSHYVIMSINVLKVIFFEAAVATEHTC